MPKQLETHPESGAERAQQLSPHPQGWESRARMLLGHPKAWLVLSSTLGCCSLLHAAGEGSGLLPSIPPSHISPSSIPLAGVSQRRGLKLQMLVKCYK